MQDLYNDTLAAIREERSHKIFKIFFKSLAGAALLVLLVGALVLGVRHFRIGAIEDSALDYYNIVHNNKNLDIDQLESYLDSRKLKNTYDRLFVLKLSQEYLKSGDVESSMKYLDVLSQDKKSPQLLHDLASLKSFALKINNLDHNSLRGEIAALEKVISKKLILESSAQELLAYAYIELGELEKAKEILQTLLKDVAAPEAIKMRSRIALSVL